MRFISGMLAATVMALALLIFTAQDAPRPPSDGLASAVPLPGQGDRTEPGAVAEIGAVAFTPVAGWQKLRPSQLRNVPDLGQFAEIADRSRDALILMDQSAAGELRGLLLVLDMGRSSTDPADVIQRAAEKHAASARATGVLWSPRRDRTGSLDSYSFGVRFRVRGEVGVRTMRGSYFAASPGGRGLLIVAIAMMGTKAETEIDRMLGTIRET